MEHPRPYDVVLSLRGHDAGKLFMVTGVSEDRVLLCDGKTRRLANPKCKSPKHVRIAAVGPEAPPASDREIRETIALTAREAAAKEVRLLGKR